MQGFVARGTELSARTLSYRKLLEQTDSALMTSLRQEEPQANNSSKRDVMSAERKRHRKKQRRKNTAQPPTARYDVTHDEDELMAHDDPFFCDAPRKSILNAKSRSFYQVMCKNCFKKHLTRTVPGTSIMHAVRKITRGILSPKFQSVRIVFEDGYHLL